MSTDTPIVEEKINILSSIFQCSENVPQTLIYILLNAT